MFENIIIMTIALKGGRHSINYHSFIFKNIFYTTLKEIASYDCLSV